MITKILSITPVAVSCALAGYLTGVNHAQRTAHLSIQNECQVSCCLSTANSQLFQCVAEYVDDPKRTPLFQRP